MTREEIDRHVAGILALRKRNNRRRGRQAAIDRGYHTTGEFDARRRRTIPGNIRTFDTDVSPVDQVFAARGRAGWLPRGGDE